jgi:hypothetical protein
VLSVFVWVEVRPTCPPVPWCRFEASKSVLFIAHQPIGRSTFNLDYVVSKIEQIQSPGPAPDLISVVPAVEKLKPSQAAKDFKRRIWARKAGGLAAASLATFLMFNGIGWGFCVMIPAGILFFGDGPHGLAMRGGREDSRGDGRRRDAESAGRHSI